MLRRKSSSFLFSSKPCLSTGWYQPVNWYFACEKGHWSLILPFFKPAIFLDNYDNYVSLLEDKSSPICHCRVYDIYGDEKAILRWENKPTNITGLASPCTKLCIFIVFNHPKMGYATYRIVNLKSLMSSPDPSSLEKSRTVPDRPVILTHPSTSCVLAIQKKKQDGKKKWTGCLFS